MFRNPMNALVAKRIVQDVGERQYHAFRRLPINNASVLQGGCVPGATSNMIVRFPPGWVPTKMFTAGFIKRHYGVTPIIAIMGLWAIGVSGYCVYAAMTRDAEYTRTGKKQHETVDLRNPHPLKLLTIKQEYKPMPELADLLDEINREAAAGPCKCD